MSRSIGSCGAEPEFALQVVSGSGRKGSGAGLKFEGLHKLESA